jgi:YVTN family beta-propeller protein
MGRVALALFLLLPLSLLLPAIASAELVMLVGQIPDAPPEPADAKVVPHLTGSSIATLSDGRLVVADSDNDAVVVLDAANHEPIHTIAVGRRPEGGASDHG